MHLTRLRSIRRTFARAARQVVLVPLIALPLGATAELNRWTKPSSGNWEEPYWSLGVLPTNGQYVAIDNEGWKAVAIGPTTTQNYPQYLTMYSLTISSPTNSRNLLLMNYAGLETPLQTRFLTVASNSAMTMLFSSLHLSGNTGEGLSIGGEFNQDESSVVTGPQADVGYIGPGLYNLNSGTLELNQMWVGGSYSGQFNQYGGSCRIGILHLDTGGSYNFYGGETAPTNIYFGGGTFFLRGGIRYQPIPPGNYVQTGGTNYGLIQFDRGGSYTLSNGVSSIASLSVGSFGRYTQWGGVQSVTGNVSAQWEYTGPRSGDAIGVIVLNGGMLAAGSMSMNGSYEQNGGTNTVSEGITIDDSRFLQLNGGVLEANDVLVKPTYRGLRMIQCGGLLIITNQLTVYGGYSSYYTLHGVSLCAGAQMIVSNIVLTNGGALVVGDRTVTQSGLFSCGPGTIVPGQGAHQFGALSLESTSTGTNSILSMPWNTNCVVRFRDSSALPWMSASRLIITNWSGSLFGGGIHQIIFGESNTALRPQQLSQILFRDPPQLAPGLYAARILSNGEIVPDALPPTGRVPPTIHLETQPGQAIRLTVIGQSGSDYGIETSSNLSSWALWTNRVATNGTMSVLDSQMTNSQAKFYRAVLLP